MSENHKEKSLSESFEDILDAYINGQGRQMVDQIDEFGWYDFTTELEETDSLGLPDKLDLLCKAIRIFVEALPYPNR